MSSVLSEFDGYVINFLAGPAYDQVGHVCTIIATRRDNSGTNRAVGQVRFWTRKSGPLQENDLNSSGQITLNFYEDILPAIQTCLQLPGLHRLNFVDKSNGTIDFEHRIPGP